MSPHSPAEVVVVGGGIAALELVLALRDLAPDLVAVPVVAPNTEFVPRPLLVADPLAGTPAPRVPLRRIADEAGFALVRASVSSVEPQRRRVALRGGGSI